MNFQINKKITEEAYPESFNIDDFGDIKSFKGRIDYAKANLQRLGSGTSRVVYKVDEQKVLKIAKNKKGVMQNSIEIDYRNQSMLFAEVFDFHNYSLWVEMEYVKKMTRKKFKELIGYDVDDIFLIFKRNNRFLSAENKIKIEEMLKNEYVKEIDSLVQNYKFLIGDFLKLDSWGIAIRENKEVPLLIDFGLTDDVFYEYYAVR